MNTIESVARKIVAGLKDGSIVPDPPMAKDDGEAMPMKPLKPMTLAQWDALCHAFVGCKDEFSETRAAIRLALEHREQLMDELVELRRKAAEWDSGKPILEQWGGP